MCIYITGKTQTRQHSHLCPGRMTGRRHSNVSVIYCMRDATLFPLGLGVNGDSLLTTVTVIEGTGSSNPPGSHCFSHPPQVSAPSTTEDHRAVAHARRIAEHNGSAKIK